MTPCPLERLLGHVLGGRRVPEHRQGHPVDQRGEPPDERRGQLVVAGTETGEERLVVELVYGRPDAAHVMRRYGCRGGSAHQPEPLPLELLDDEEAAAAAPTGLPAVVTAAHLPPKATSPCPLASPGLVSAEKVYSGEPA